jgi:hypothetical protein
LAKANFCPIGDFFKPYPTELRLGLKNYQVGEKWVSDDSVIVCHWISGLQILCAQFSCF